MCSGMFRHIDKVGGLDNYILTVPEKKQQSDLALELRHKIEAALQKPLRDALKANSEVNRPLWLPSHACCCLLAFSSLRSPHFSGLQGSNCTAYPLQAIMGWCVFSCRAQSSSTPLILSSPMLSANGARIIQGNGLLRLMCSPVALSFLRQNLWINN